MKKITAIKVLVPAVCLLVGTNFAFAKTNLKELTTAKQATIKEIPKKAKSPITVVQKANENKHTVTLGIGQTFLLGNFHKNGDDRIAADFYYTYKASYSFDLFTNFHYSKHKKNGRYTKLPAFTAGLKARLFDFDSFSPYVLGGMGFYRPQTKRPVDSAMEKSEAKFTFGLNVGVGADLKLNDEFTAGLLIHYHDPFDVDQDRGHDVTGSYYKFMMTAGYSF